VLEKKRLKKVGIMKKQAVILNTYRGIYPIKIQYFIIKIA